MKYFLFRIASVCLALQGTFEIIHADDCGSIREALARLPSSGGEVVIPSGNYVCESPIVLNHDHMKLRGKGNVTLRLADGADSPVIVMGDIHTPPAILHDLRIADLTIDGNRLHQPDECWSGGCDTGGTTFIRNNGVTVRAVISASIRDVSVAHSRSGGVVSERGCNQMLIDHLTVTDSQFDGFAGGETTGSLINNLLLYENLAAGISLDNRFDGNTIRDARLFSNRDVGIFMRDSRDNYFEKIDIADSGSHGVFLAEIDAIGTCPINNFFSDLTVRNSKGYGFYLKDRCIGNRLAGRTLFKSNHDGCVFTPDSSESDGLLFPERPYRITCEN